MNTMRYTIKLAILSIFFVVFFSAGCAKAPSSPTTPVITSDNQPPVINNISFPEDVMALTDNLITCAATDPDGDDLTYVWSTDDGTIKGEGAGIVWVAPGLVGKYEVNVVVSDGKGGEATQSVTIRLVTNADGSTNPIVTLKLSLSSGEPAVEKGRTRIWTTTDILCQVDGSSTNGIKYTWSATEGKLQGKGLAEGTANRVTWIAPGVAGESTVTVTATDNTGKATTGKVSFTVFCCSDI
jgi:hypothetical protein